MSVAAISSSIPLSAEVERSPLISITDEIFCKIVEFADLATADALSHSCRSFHRRINGFDLLTFFVARRILWDRSVDSLPLPLRSPNVDPVIMENFMHHAPALWHRIVHFFSLDISNLLKQQMAQFLTESQRCTIWRNYLNRCGSRLDISPFIDGLSRPMDKKIVGICRTRPEIDWLNLGDLSLEDASFLTLLPNLKALFAPNVSFKIADLPALKNITSLTLGRGSNSFLGSGNSVIDLSIFSKSLKELILILGQNQILTSPNLNLIGNSIENLLLIDDNNLTDLKLRDFFNLKFLTIQNYNSEVSLRNIELHQCPQLKYLSIINILNQMPENGPVQIDVSQCVGLINLTIKVRSLLLNGLENCQQLETLDLNVPNFNFQVSDLPHLKSFRFFGRELSVQRLPALQELDIYLSAALNIGDLPKLKKLSIHTLSTVLDLTHLQTQYLTIVGRNLTNIAFPQGVKELSLDRAGEMTRINLIGQALEKLSVRNCIELTNIAGLEQQRKTLTSLEMDYGRLRSLNLRGFFLLRELSITNCFRLESLDVKGCTALQENNLHLEHLVSLKDFSLDVEYNTRDRCLIALANTSIIDAKAAAIFRKFIPIWMSITISSVFSNTMPTIVAQCMPITIGAVGVLPWVYGTARFVYKLFQNYHRQF